MTLWRVGVDGKTHVFCASGGFASSSWPQAARSPPTGELGVQPRLVLYDERKKKPSIIRSTSLLIRSKLSCVATFWLAGGLIWSALPRLSSHTRPSFVVWLRLGASAFLRPLAMQSGLLAVHAFQNTVLRSPYRLFADRPEDYPLSCHYSFIQSFTHLSPSSPRPRRVSRSVLCTSYH